MSYDHLIEKLALVYPRTFFLDQAKRRPLKQGIRRDLSSDITHGLTDAEIRQALGWYCRSAGYLASMIEGTARVNLAGEPSGTVSAEAVGAAIKTARSQQEQQASSCRAGCGRTDTCGCGG
jgi:ProP effector